MLHTTVEKLIGDSGLPSQENTGTVKEIRAMAMFRKLKEGDQQAIMQLLTSLSGA